MNPIFMLIYNQTPAQFDLTRAAIDSAFAQDIPVDLFLIDNGSTDPKTWPYLQSLPNPNLTIEHHPGNLSPVHLSNWWMNEILHNRNYLHMLGMPNDVILPPNLYSEFLKWPRGIVCGSMSADRNFTRFEKSSAMNECTPMAVSLTRRWAYDALISRDGFFFDPRFFLYASDCDFALRIASCGIRGVQLDIQYYHYGSASHRLALPDKVPKMAFRADQDRAEFVKKWGFGVSDYEYGALANDINFRGDSQ